MLLMVRGGFIADGTVMAGAYAGVAEAGAGMPRAALNRLLAWADGWRATTLAPNWRVSRASSAEGLLPTFERYERREATLGANSCVPDDMAVGREPDSAAMLLLAGL